MLDGWMQLFSQKHMLWVSAWPFKDQAVQERGPVPSSAVIQTCLELLHEGVTRKFCARISTSWELYVTWFRRLWTCCIARAEIGIWSFYKSVPRKFFKRASHKSVLRECRAGVPKKSVLLDFPARVTRKCVSKESQSRAVFRFMNDEPYSAMS